MLRKLHIYKCTSGRQDSDQTSEFGTETGTKCAGVELPLFVLTFNNSNMSKSVFSLVVFYIYISDWGSVVVKALCY